MYQAIQSRRAVVNRMLKKSTECPVLPSRRHQHPWKSCLFSSCTLAGTPVSTGTQVAALHLPQVQTPAPGLPGSHGTGWIPSKPHGEHSWGHRERGQAQRSERKILSVLEEYESQASLAWVWKQSTRHSIIYCTFLARQEYFVVISRASRAL